MMTKMFLCFFRINLADLLSKLNQTEQAQRILDQLLKEEGYFT
jgi:hypothetical protein